MYDQLSLREELREPVRVSIHGATRAGIGLAWQIGRTPGLELVSVSDPDLNAASEAARAYGGPRVVLGPDDPLPGWSNVIVTPDPAFLFEKRAELGIDVLVEASTSAGPSARTCLTAIKQGIHIVLMNTRLDLILGPFLRHVADGYGVVVSSDSGQRHGGLGRLIDDVRLWGLDIVMAGAVGGSIPERGDIQLATEMAVLANAKGLRPCAVGMELPTLPGVDDLLHQIDFTRYDEQAVIECIRCPGSPGGIFVVGRCEDEIPRRHLSEMGKGSGPHYVFHRADQLGPMDTVRAIARAGIEGRSVMSPENGRLVDVFAYAKKPIAVGELIDAAVAEASCYGLIDVCERAERDGRMPIALLEPVGKRCPIAKRALGPGEPIRFTDIDLPPGDLWSLFRRQEGVLQRRRPSPMVDQAVIAFLSTS